MDSYTAYYMIVVLAQNFQKIAISLDAAIALPSHRPHRDLAQLLIMFSHTNLA